ncbi:MAG: 2Fe-2S iron-sulfur cluster binding domain-containing protein [Ruminococcaceae bacterium]|nr:2Fe-2S iron-sulfur cluster binding domain-containing protein [Oscillospiraceae bacterium]
MTMVNIKIDGIALQVEEGITILEAAKRANIKIPTLCFLKDINEIGACRMCVVEIKGARALQAACVYPVAEGLEVFTNSEKVRKARRVTLELILSNHDRSCLTCPRSENCELQTLAKELNIKEIRFPALAEKDPMPIDDMSPSIVRNPNKCILCRRCVSMCKNVQTVSVIDTMERGFRTVVGCAFDKALVQTPCVACGQCIAVCPVGALTEKSAIDDVWAAIADPKKHVVFQTAPAVRVSIGEAFGMPIGSRPTGKMVTAIRMLGVDKVFDTNTGADLTIMEEGTELLDRIKNGGKLPMITSCSPGWIKFCEHNYPDFLDNLSSCKSPHQMLGAVLKTYYAEKMGIDPASIYVVSVMPCTAKKYESKRSEMKVNDLCDVDAVLTTRELAQMIKESGIDFVNLTDSDFDNPLGNASGAGVIFGATGGVMEAALRTVNDVLTGEEAPVEKIEYHAVRGVEGIKEATVNIAGKDIRVAVASGLGNARKLLDSIRAGEADYDFIEIMACPGGCVNGGGQIIQPSSIRSWTDLRAVRAAAAYQEDCDLPIRKSHHNPFVKALYDEYYGEPGSEKAHHELHTHYYKRDNY